MADILARAIKHDRSAMRKLYTNNKRQAYFIALRLLDNDEKAAAEAVSSAFASAWGNLAKMPSLDAFDEYILVSVIERCKKQLASKNSKAFRIPDSRRFLINTLAPVTSDENVVEAILKQLPTFERTIFILHAASGLGDTLNASAVKLDARTWQIATEDERVNIERMLNGTSYTYDDIVKEFAAGCDTVSVPRSLDETVEQQIKPLAAPLEKKRRLHLLYITIGVVLSCALVGGMCYAAIDWVKYQSSLPGAADTTASSTRPTTAPTNEKGYTEEEIKANPALKTVGTVTSVTPTHYAEITIKDHGTIKVGLDAKTAPLTVNNFKTLADAKFYDGLTLHRIIKDFMMQGGDPKGNGTGGATNEDGSEKNLVGEFAENQIENPLSHVRGAISMARANDYNSASSQFFIVHKDSTVLDGQYAVFGYVTEGMDIVDAVCEAAKPIDDNGTIPDQQQPVITSVVVYEAK